MPSKPPSDPLLSNLTPYQTQYIAWQLSRRMGADSADLLASTLVDARVDLNPHQVDEAHRLRNVYRPGNVIGKTLKEALAHAPKVLLTATPLQNTLLELFGLVSLVDERVFGDLPSFRDQFGGLGNAATFAKLRARLATVCLRTLRRQVQPSISYTRRIPMVEAFTPSQDEQHLRELVAEYLRRPSLNALPSGQRQLISLVLWKLLASSSYAIGGALGTMAKRLEGKVAAAGVGSSDEGLDDDYEALEETAEEWGDEDADPAAPRRGDIGEEIAELRQFQRLATHIRDNTKGQALLKALDKAFVELVRLGANKKALIFTESRRTQVYLLNLLEHSPYAGQTVLFNGTNTGEQAQRIYADWLKRREGTDRITGSRTSDTRAALVEHFRDSAPIMIATEAGAEGINLQFCSLVINYDLPWNPQRIEQRIGRCHRYGQKHDVVVVNFIDHSNPADKRVYELLAQKFQLFEGVFGASDEVLGTIGSGVDFERRIAEIYQTCRNPLEIEASFHPLQSDLSGEINAAMLKTRQLLMENFDEAVQDKLKLRQDESTSARNRKLPPARLRFDYDGYGAKLSTLASLRGTSGWLALRVLTIEALGAAEDYLLLAATSASGEPLHDEDAEKLLRLPAQLLDEPVTAQAPSSLGTELERLANERTSTVNSRNLGYFDAEVQKLDAWADDLKSGLENEVKALDREIKEVRRTAAAAPTLEEKLRAQKQQRELEARRTQLRRRIFDRQDEIDGERGRLIELLESKLSRSSTVASVFVVQWQLV